MSYQKNNDKPALERAFQKVAEQRKAVCHPCESCRHTEPLAYVDGHFDGDGCAVFHAYGECT